ncbi:hypothetical protein ASPWEDRAFT_74393, partial [Aspergillus wentii DTO 134E9]
SSKRKASDGNNASKSTPKVIHFTSRNPPWTYLKLQLIHQPDTSTAIQSHPLDPLTARTHLTTALSQFLGLTGTTISIDILKISSDVSAPNKDNKMVWIRVPRPDAAAVVAALSSWIGGSSKSGSVAWRVCAKGNYLGALVRGNGEDLF